MDYTTEYMVSSYVKELFVKKESEHLSEYLVEKELFKNIFNKINDKYKDGKIIEVEKEDNFTTHKATLYVFSQKELDDFLYNIKTEAIRDHIIEHNGNAF